MEIIVDAYGTEELAMGWYYCLEETIEFAFSAVCCERCSILPLKVHDKVVVVGMADEWESEKEMFVSVRWGKMISLRQYIKRPVEHSMFGGPFLLRDGKKSLAPMPCMGNHNCHSNRSFP